MKLRFSPVLLGFVVAGAAIFAAQISLSASSFLLRVSMWVVLLLSFWWLGSLLWVARETGIASFPIFVWYWDIDRRNAEPIYFLAVLGYYTGLFSGVVIAAIWLLYGTR